MYVLVTASDLNQTLFIILQPSNYIEVQEKNK